MNKQFCFAFPNFETSHNVGWLLGTLRYFLRPKLYVYLIFQYKFILMSKRNIQNILYVQKKFGSEEEFYYGFVWSLNLLLSVQYFLFASSIL